MRKKKTGFTLIELLLVMALLGVLATLLIGSFSATLKRGRDQARKNDLSQLQKTLELYYDENGKYPDFAGGDDIFGKRLCATVAVDSATQCPLIPSTTTRETTYMIKTPKDASSTYVYKYVPVDIDGKSAYYLYSYIENEKDQGANVKQAGYSVNCDKNDSIKCKYYVSSSNATPL